MTSRVISTSRMGSAERASKLTCEVDERICEDGASNHKCVTSYLIGVFENIIEAETLQLRRLKW